MESPPLYGYYDYLEYYYESYYERRHNRLLNETCNDRSESSKYYNSSVYLNPICAQIRNMTAYDHINTFPGDMIVPPFASLSIICCIASILIAILFFYQLSKVLKKPKSPDKFTTIVSSSCIIFHVCYNILDPFTFYLWLIDYERRKYHLVASIYELLWGLSKISLYSIFAYRYYILSQASIYDRFKTSKKVVLFGSIISMICIQAALQIGYIIVLYKYTYVGWDDLELELYYMRLYLNIGWAIVGVDFVTIGVLGFLIIKTILNLVIMIDFRSDHSELSLSASSVQSNSVSSSSSVSKKNRKQVELVELSTRIALTAMFSMLSSFSVYAGALIIEETESWHLSYVTYVWCLDNVINMSCVYFSMAFGKHHYKTVCQEYCFCHQCFYCCLNKLVNARINKKHRREMEEGQNAPEDVVNIEMR